MKQRIFYEEFDSLYYYRGSTQNWNMQGFHFHKNYEIILFMCDGATIYIDNRVYTVQKGDLFLINNKEYHKTVGLNGSEYKRYVLMFDPDSIEEISETMEYNFTVYFEERPDNFIHRIKLEGDTLIKVIELFHKIEECNSNKQCIVGKIKLNLAILELLVQINELFDFFLSSIEKEKENVISDLEFQDAIPYRERVELIKKYIVKHIEEKLDLDEIASQVFLNKYYLSHYFKKETGFTLTQYIANQKIIAAKSMLKKGYSVTDVALVLSYNSDSHFINVFKKVTGTTPKQYSIEKNSNNV